MNILSPKEYCWVLLFVIVFLIEHTGLTSSWGVASIPGIDSRVSHSADTLTCEVRTGPQLYAL